MIRDKTKAPGSARAPGASVADVLCSDLKQAPEPLLEQRYSFLGDEDIPVQRYTSTSFFQQELTHLWPRAWQWACREEHIPDIGDNHVYEVGPYSVIIVRSNEHTIRAFLNSCTHRGTKILASEGCGYSQSFTCPFHGWSWHLDGSIKNIPARWDFPHVEDSSHSLRAVSCEVWGGFVFINMDPAAAPLAQYLDVMPQHFKHFPLERRRIKVHVEKTLPANWKAAQEAFMEAYHNVETHDSPNGANAQYDVFGKYVSRFIHNIGNYSADSLSDYAGTKWRDPVVSEAEQLAGLGLAGEGGNSTRATAAQEYRDRVARDTSADVSASSDSEILDSIEYHLFPNMFFFPGFLIPMVYRFRPNGVDVDSCLFDLLILEPLAAGAEHPEPPEPIKLGVEQSYTSVEALAWLGPVYDEDTSNLQAQQQGFKTSLGKAGITLGNYQEARIRRVHLTLDEFLGAH